MKYSEEILFRARTKEKLRQNYIDISLDSCIILKHMPSKRIAMDLSLIRELQKKGSLTYE